MAKKETKEPEYGDIDKGKDGPVRRLQTVLSEQGFYKADIDGKFFDKTLKAVNEFRAVENLPAIPKPTPAEQPEVKAEPKATPETVEDLFEKDSEIKKVNLATLPEDVQTPKGKDPTTDGPSVKYLTDDQRRGLFGRYQFSPYPAENTSGQEITIFNDPATGRNWETDNIESVLIPQLKGIPLYSLDGQKHSGNVRVHKLIVPQLKGLFEKLEADGLMKLFLTYDGSFMPRYIRGSKTSLSNHAFGTALDFNAPWNGLGQEPPKVGEKGSLRLAVPYFEAFGFYWGGYFSRKDGMHIEACKVLGVLPVNVRSK